MSVQVAGIMPSQVYWGRYLVLTRNGADGLENIILSSLQDEGDWAGGCGPCNFEGRSSSNVVVRVGQLNEGVDDGEGRGREVEA